MTAANMHRSHYFLCLSFLLIATRCTPAQAQSCRSFGEPSEQRIACVCDAKVCDSLMFEWPQDGSTVVQVTSDQSGKRFEVSQLETLEVDSAQPVEVKVDTRSYAQQIVGWGGAFTDSAMTNLLSLPEPVRRRAFDDYFSPQGLAYNMGRVPIGGTDMSERKYSNDDLPTGQCDPKLSQWSLQPEDLELKVPGIQRANAIRAEHNLEPLKLIATSWSMPGWMKTNGELLEGHLKSQYYDAYARYLLKFLQAYEQQGIETWALAAENQPSSPLIAPQNSCYFTPKELVRFMSQNLIPTLQQHNYTLGERLKLVYWDDMGYVTKFEDYLRAAYGNKRLRESMSAVAVHWYIQVYGDVRYESVYGILQSVRKSGYMLMSTEASLHPPIELGNWAHGEEYARNIMVLLSAGSSVWLDWNLATNTSGGPTWSENRLNAAILVDRAQGVYFKNPIYYVMGHFSRFLRAESRVLDTQVVGMAPEAEHTQVYAATAELDADTGTRRLALVLFNRSGEQRNVHVQLANCASRAELSTQVGAHSITSFAFTC